MKVRRLKRFNIVCLVAISTIVFSCKENKNETEENVNVSEESISEVFDIDKNLNYCVDQAVKTLALVPKDSVFPRNVKTKEKDWRFVPVKDWTSGFWPGTLWYLYEHTKDDMWKKEADKFSRFLIPLSKTKAHDHDLGFQMFCSFGNAYRLTKNEDYKDIYLRTADTLATLYNPTVGTILSWPAMVKRKGWPHNTIIDNMINLEMLLQASKTGKNSKLYDLAVNHAEKTMDNHFREDNSTYHVIVYDTITGQKIKGVTHQGHADESMWARGQAWAIYGFTMVYRETKDKKFLDFAHKVSKVYLDKLPEDFIPYWDFNAPNIPNEPKDASASAIVASALIELSNYTENTDLKNKYLNSAEATLKELSSNYQSGEANTSFLLHSTGHHPNGSEIDASIIYADYYYIEALLRLKKVKNGLPLF